MNRSNNKKPLKSILSVSAIAALLIAVMSMTAVPNVSASIFEDIQNVDDVGQSLECVIVVVGCDGQGSVGSSGDVIIGSGNNDNNGPPVPPGDRCPDDYVWDITIRGTAEQGGVPVGTVICLTEGLGNHPATVVEPNQEPYVTDVNTNQPNQANCNAPGQQLAEVTSGNPPNPLEMGSDLCATVSPQ